MHPAGGENQPVAGISVAAPVGPVGAQRHGADHREAQHELQQCGAGTPELGKVHAGAHEPQGSHDGDSNADHSGERPERHGGAISRASR
jgi:hypothetical protein